MKMARKSKKKSIEKIWLVCEGGTEVQYFKGLKNHKRTPKIEIIPAKENTSANSIIDYAISLKDGNVENKQPDKGDTIAILFDRDDNSNESLEQTRSKANRKNILIIFSNPCFEFWLLSCMEQSRKTPCECSDVESRLRRYIDFVKGEEYKKSYEDTCNGIKDATRFNRQLEKVHSENPIHRESNPLSMVYRAIEKIDDIMKDD